MNLCRRSMNANRGVYKQDNLMFAVNRPLTEDQYTTIADEKLESLFAGLQMDRVVDQKAGRFGGIVREIWRQFLILMVAALIFEAALCLPKKWSKPSQNSKQLAYSPT